MIYEHQYLANQLHRRERFGELDGDRVLLYPSTVSQTQPTLVALNEDADRLGRLLTIDPDLRRSMLACCGRKGAIMVRTTMSPTPCATSESTLEAPGGRSTPQRCLTRQPIDRED